MALSLSYFNLGILKNRDFMTLWFVYAPSFCKYYLHFISN